MVDEAIATAQEVARRQIEALERPAREAAERAAEQTRETIEDLSTSIVQFGDARAQFVERHLAQLGEGATPEERAEVERMANQLYDLEQAQRAAARGGRAAASASREANAIMAEGEAVYRSVMTAAEEYAATMADLSRLLEAGAISQETHARAVAEAQKQLKELQEQLEEFETEERRRLLRASDNPLGGGIAWLEEYVEKSRESAGAIEQGLSQAFAGAEDAVGDFVRTGKIEFGSLVSSILADMAQLSIRKMVLTPLADSLVEFPRRHRGR